MTIIVVDDERFVLSAEVSAVSRVLPRASIYSFQRSKDAAEFANSTKVDIAFLDINIKGVTGLQLAERLQELNPQVNIVFCTGYSEYSLEAHDLYCSAYLLKPITDEKVKKALENLRHPLELASSKLQVQCFGNFELYKDGVPVKFKHKKTKELFAYLVDRKGATVSTKEMLTALFDDDSKQSYIRNLRADLKNTLKELGADDVLVRNGGDIGINLEKVDCDYFDYLHGDKSLFYGEYMSQYAFAEGTLGRLTRE